MNKSGAQKRTSTDRLIDPTTGTGPVAGPYFAGKFRRLPGRVEYQFEDGMVIVGPEDTDTSIGDVLEIGGKLFDLYKDLFGDDDGDGGNGVAMAAGAVGAGKLDHHRGQPLLYVTREGQEIV